MSLTHDDLEDIKQLMEAVVYQNNGVLKQELKDELKQELVDEFGKRFDEIDQRFDEVDQRFDEVLNAIGEDMAKHTAKLDDHEDRLRRLEQKAA